MSKNFFTAVLALLLAVIMTVSVFAELSTGSSTTGDNIDLSDLIEVEIPDTPIIPDTPVPGSSPLLAHWTFDEVRGNTVTDNVGNKIATLSNAAFEPGISGNGIRFDGAKNGMIDFGERGITSLVDGKSKYSVSMWIMPSYYIGVSASRLFTLGANADGAALLDVNWGKNNGRSDSRPGISATVRATHADSGVMKFAKYSIEGAVIPNLSNMEKDDTTFGVWQLLTVSVDVEGGTYSVYINGDKKISQSFTPSVDVLNVGTAAIISDTIGYSAASPDTAAFNGVVDDFRVYDGILSEQEISKLLEGQTDTSSPTADQRLVDALTERMGNSAVLYRGSSSVLLGGRIDKLDKNDYSLTTVFKNRTKVYVPKAFALSYFRLETVETDEDGYVELNALCEAQGYELYYSFSEKLAIITPQGVASFSEDDAKEGGYTNLEYRQRMIAFFENPYYTEPTVNTEQSRKVVYTSEELEKWVYSPSICTLNGVIYASCDINSDYTLVFASKDGGNTWTQMSKIDKMRCATLFAYDGQLYLLGSYAVTTVNSIGICGTRNITDEALTWSTVSSIRCDFIEKTGHCSSTPVLIANGRVYKAFEDGSIWASEKAIADWYKFLANATPEQIEEAKKNNKDNYTKKAFVVSCDLNDNILNGANWTVSNYITITAKWTMEQIGTTTISSQGATAIEGNMVQAPDGTVYNVLRLNCEPANGYAVCLELSADGKTLSSLDESKVINLPGGENKFNIRYDETTGYYLSLVNNNTAPYWPMQRNVLSLVASKDLINWEIIDTILIDRTMLNFDVSMAIHAFQYVDWCFDGDDIIFTVRETMGDTNYFHNGYELTFYRLDNYKSLLDYTPPVEEPDALIPDEGTEYEDSSSNLAKYIIIGVSVAVALAIAGAIIWFVIFKKRKKFIK